MLRDSVLSPPIAERQSDDIKALSIRNIPEHRIDMAPHLCFDSDCARLVSELKALNLYNEDFGFSVVHPDLLNVVRTTGTYRISEDGQEKDTIFCLRAAKDAYGEESLVDRCGQHTWGDYVRFGNEECRAGIPVVIFDLSKLELTAQADEYRFICERKLDAVLGFIILDNM